MWTIEKNGKLYRYNRNLLLGSGGFGQVCKIKEIEDVKKYTKF